MSALFIKDLTVVIAMAALMTYLCRLLRQPVVIGYLVAGIIIGPHTPPFQLVQDLHSIHTMAHLGMIVLMFSLGLEFSLPKLHKVGGRAAAATALELFGMLAIGYACGQAMGWSVNDSIFLGAILSISSTTIILKVLTDMKLTQEPFAQAVFGILILEDIAAVLILTILSGLGARQGLPSLPVIRAIGNIGFFVALFLIGGLMLIPRLFGVLGKFRSAELSGLAALGLCLASSLLAMHFGFSVALGAFLMGAVIGVSSEVEAIEKWIHPIRDLFSAIFFVSAGLQIDPQLLWSIRGPVAIVTVVTILGKMAAGTFGSLLAGYSIQTSSRIGVTLSQIGEFSFVIAGLGITTGTGSPLLFPMAVSVSALTTFVTPYLIRHSDKLAHGLLKLGPKALAHTSRTPEEELARASSGSTSILSRYLWRLLAYTALLVAGFLITGMASDAIRHHVPDDLFVTKLVWILSWILLLPFVLAVAEYVNHFLLLAITEVIMQTRAAVLFQKIPIQGSYVASEIVIWASLAGAWLSQAFTGQAERPAAVAAFVLMGVIAWVARKPVRLIYEKLEEHLDDIIGLASSEPLRPAKVAVTGTDAALNDSIQRIMINAHSHADEHSLRSLQLRDRTGASVIAIYRHGALNANPSPDTILNAGDILVVLGNPAETRKARRFLQESAT